MVKIAKIEKFNIQKCNTSKVVEKRAFELLC